MTTPHSTKKRILVVEDNVDLAIEWKELLEKRIEDSSVDIAHTKEKAEELIRSCHYDLAILDIWLPSTEEEFIEVDSIIDNLVEAEAKLQQLEERMRDGEDTFMDEMKLKSKQSELERKRDEILLVMNGLEIAKHILHNQINTPFIFLTAIGDDQQVREIQKDFTHEVKWLVKPCESSRIIDCCKEAMNGQ